MYTHVLMSLLFALATVAGCSNGTDDDSAGDDDTLAGDDDVSDDDDTADEPGFAMAGHPDTITVLTFTPDLTATGAPESTLTVSWTFGDGTTLDSGPVIPVEHQYLTTGPFTVVMQYESTVEGGPAGSATETVTVEHPDYWPTIVPCYYVTGFTQDPVDEMVADPYNVRAVMLAAFDLYDTSNDTVNQQLIDDLHSAGLLVWVDVAQWNPPWSEWNDMAAIFVTLVEAGIDGIDFDEFGSGGPDLSAASFNALQGQLRAINPSIRLAVTQQYLVQVETLLDDGATPDYFALEWYLYGANVFDEARDLSIETNIRFAYWVDPTTYDYVEQTYDEANSVFMWNLCWNQFTCGDDYPYNTWVPWTYVAPHVMSLGPGLE